jgi:hypothetical protein
VASSTLLIHLSSVIVGRLLIGKTGRIIQLFLPNPQSPRVSANKALFRQELSGTATLTNRWP